VHRTVEAEDRFAVYAIARTEGHTVKSVDETSAFSVSNWINIDKVNQMLNRVKDDELIMMTRNLGSMLNAGLTLTRALTVIERQSSNPKLKAVITNIVEKVNKGDQFFEALKDHPKVFNDLYVSMVRAGEETGELAETFKTLSIQMERSNNLKKKIKGAMIYPIIVIIIMVGIGILMMIFVMPQVTSVFASLGSDLPGPTKALIAASDFFAKYTLLVILGMIGSVFGFLYFLKTHPGRLASSWIVTRLPVIGTMAKETNAARSRRCWPLC